MNNLTPEAPCLSELLGKAERVGSLRQGLEGAGVQRQFFDASPQDLRLDQLLASHDAGKLVISFSIHVAITPLRGMGLSEALKGRGGISAYLPPSGVAAQPTVRRPLLYRKNGILVGHTGRTITPEDVANALAEE
jgi:hypothetical protein